MWRLTARRDRPGGTATSMPSVKALKSTKAVTLGAPSVADETIERSIEANVSGLGTWSAAKVVICATDQGRDVR